LPTASAQSFSTGALDEAIGARVSCAGNSFYQIVDTTDALLRRNSRQDREQLHGRQTGSAEHAGLMEPLNLEVISRMTASKHWRCLRTTSNNNRRIRRADCAGAAAQASQPDKWSDARFGRSVKYIICNGDGGDPARS
jgi:hypothetical protein